MVGVKPEELPTIEQEVEFDGSEDINDGNTPSATYTSSGTYEIIWERESPDETDDFKPIAPDGVVKFFGRINDGLDAGVTNGDDVTGFGPFKNIGSNISLDEDVISGEPNEPPVMTLNISVPDATDAAVQIQAIFYETSGIEYIQGGEKCYADPDSDPADLRALAQAACTSGEIEDEASFVLHAESDEDAADDKKQLALQETGRFTGIFQGKLTLTDADGDGGTPRINWGRTKMDGAYEEATVEANWA